MAISIPAPTRSAWTWPRIGAAAMPAMFGPASATALLAGIGAGLALPWLPVWPLLVMTLLVNQMAQSLASQELR